MKRRWWIVGLVGVLIALGIWAGRPRPTAVAMIHVRCEPSMFDIPPYTEFSPEDAEKLRKNVAWAATTQWVILAAVHRLDDRKRVPGAPDRAPDKESREHLQEWITNDLRVRFIGDEWVEVSLPAGGGGDAVAVVNAVVNAIQSEVVDRMQQVRYEQLERLILAEKEMADRLAIKRRQLAEQRRKIDAMPQLTDVLKSTLVARRVELAEKEAKLARRRPDGASPVGTEADELETEVEDLRAVIARLEKEPERDTSEYLIQLEMLEDEVQRLDDRLRPIQERIYANQFQLHNSPAPATVIPAEELEGRSWIGEICRDLCGCGDVVGAEE